jgi:holo-[acyl-carrier protein] synthase
MNAPGVLGTGVDLVENVRMRQMLQRWGDRFKDKVFLASEQEYCESKASPWLYYAGRFAVKEAVSKAFGTGIGPHLAWLDIEVARDSTSGAPFVRLNNKGRQLLESRGAGSVLVSMSHTHNFAIAHALLVAREASCPNPVEDRK